MNLSTEIARELDDPERERLLKELETLSGICTVDSALWACLWFADIEALQQLVDKCKREKHEAIIMLRSFPAAQTIKFCKCQLLINISFILLAKNTS